MIKVTLAALLLMTVDGADKSPCNVTMTQSAICYNQSLVKIPQDIPDNVTTLNVNYNRIEFTDAGDWQRYGQLKHLFIKGNRIRTVDEEAFLNLSELSYVDLSFNRLTYIGRYVFWQNMNLITVVLNGNKLSLDPALPFLISHSIEHLELENCCIWQISSVTFSKMEKLKFLSVYENNILSLDPASFQYTSLEALYINPAGELKSTLNKIDGDGVTVHFSENNNTENFCTGWTRETTRKVDLQTNVEQTLSSRAETELTTQNNNMTDNETQTICLDRAWLLIIAPITLIMFCTLVILTFTSCRKQKTNPGEICKSSKAPTNQDSDLGCRRSSASECPTNAASGLALGSRSSASSAVSTVPIWNELCYRQRVRGIRLTVTRSTLPLR